MFTEEELKAMDQDIVEETKRVRKDNESHDTRMILQDLRKTYKNFKYGVIPNHFTAVKGTNVVLETGKLFCLLGQVMKQRKSKENIFTYLARLFFRMELENQQRFQC